MVPQFKNLGSTKTSQGDCSMDICCRIAMAKNRMTSLSNIWKDKSISENLKIKLVKTLVWTVMTYGSEGWTLKSKDIKGLMQQKCGFFRRMLRISWKEKRTNASILGELNVLPELLNTIKSRKLSFFGHVCRSKCTLMKDVIQGKMEGKRERGRPKTNYIGNIREWTRMDNRMLYDAVADREKWADVCRRQVRAANVTDDDAG